MRDGKFDLLKAKVRAEDAQSVVWSIVRDFPVDSQEGKKAGRIFTELRELELMLWDRISNDRV